MLTRRSFVHRVAIAPIAAGLSRWQDGSRLSIDSARLRSRLETLSLHGRPPGAGFEGGVSRVAYSDADVAGRAYVMGLMREAGLEPRIDPAGNIFARRPGTDASLKSILFGSHIKVAAASPPRPASAVSRSARRADRCRRAATSTATSARSRRSRYSPCCASGGRQPGARWRSSSGRTKRALRSAAVWPAAASSPEISHPAILPRHGTASGATTLFAALVARRSASRTQPARRGRSTATSSSTSSRARTSIASRCPSASSRASSQSIGTTRSSAASRITPGTTPMADRQDALIAASQLALAVREIVTREPGRQVGTVGHLEVDGISHSPRERTSWEDCARGADLLLQTVLAMDRDV